MFVSRAHYCPPPSPSPSPELKSYYILSAGEIILQANALTGEGLLIAPALYSRMCRVHLLNSSVQCNFIFTLMSIIYHSVYFHLIKLVYVSFTSILSIQALVLTILLYACPLPTACLSFCLPYFISYLFIILLTLILTTKIGITSLIYALI